MKVIKKGKMFWLSTRYPNRISSWKHVITNPSFEQITYWSKDKGNRRDRELVKKKQAHIVKATFLQWPPWRFDCTTVWANPKPPPTIDSHKHPHTDSRWYRLPGLPHLLCGCSRSHWLMRWHSHPGLLTTADVFVCEGVCLWEGTPKMLVWFQTRADSNLHRSIFTSLLPR